MLNNKRFTSTESKARITPGIWFKSVWGTYS